MVGYLTIYYDHIYHIKYEQYLVCYWFNKCYSFNSSKGRVIKYYISKCYIYFYIWCFWNNCNISIKITHWPYFYFIFFIILSLLRWQIEQYFLRTQARSWKVYIWMIAVLGARDVRGEWWCRAHLPRVISFDHSSRAQVGDSWLILKLLLPPAGKSTTAACCGPPHRLFWPHFEHNIKTILTTFYILKNSQKPFIT